MKKLFLSNFQLKLIAIISMTIDHVGLFLFNIMPENSTIYIVSTICRYIGRLALPLFCFLLVEGVLHTHNFKKYMLRLGIVAFCIALFQSFGEIMYYANKANIDYRFQSTNIFITLILGALMIYCFENKNKGVKSLGLIPIAISICAFVCTCLEWENNITIWWFPYLLRPEYDWLGIGMILVFYGAYKIVPKLYDYYGFKSELYLDTFNYRIYVNTFCFLGLTIISFLYFATYFIYPKWVYWNPDIQLFAIITGFILLLYNGKRGYNKKWFNIFAYIYYPAHLILLYGIFAIIGTLI